MHRIAMQCASLATSDDDERDERVLGLQAATPKRPDARSSARDARRRRARDERNATQMLSFESLAFDLQILRRGVD
jgi:hypothetical protein